MREEDKQEMSYLEGNIRRPQYLQGFHSPTPWMQRPRDTGDTYMYSSPHASTPP